MTKISIVVPVYKVENYLDRCLKSILTQTYKDYDLILVDDGSPDNSGKICDDYVAKDSRIHVIHQKNGGLSAARNSGIEWSIKNSDSKWITFVDSDDWIHPQYLELLLHYSEEKQLSICMAEFLITGQKTEFQSIPQEIFSIERTEDAFQDENLDPSSACGRLFKKDLFQDIRFPVGKLHEDRFTTYKLYFQFKTVGVVHTPLYFYFVNQDGITHTEWHPRKMDNIEAAEQQLAFFKEIHNDEMYLYILKDYINLCIVALRGIEKSQKYNRYAKIVRKKLRQILHKERKLLNYNLKDQFNIYKYAYPLAMKIYRRLFM